MIEMTLKSNGTIGTKRISQLELANQSVPTSIVAIITELRIPRTVQ